MATSNTCASPGASTCSTSDSRERADLRERRPDDFARLKAAWAEWNAAMLPYPADSFSETPKGRLVDRY